MKILLAFSFCALCFWNISYAFVVLDENVEKVKVNARESNLIELEVKLKSYSKNGFYMDFVNGSSESLEASKVVILKPLKHKGKALIITNTGLAGQSKKWKKRGANFLIAMPEEFLNSVYIDVRLVKFVK